MIATPESGVDSIAVSWAMLDPVMTVIRPVAAFITAVSTGIMQNFFGTEPKINPFESSLTGNGCVYPMGSSASSPMQPPSFFEQFKNGMIYAYGTLLSDIAKPFVIGILIAGAITFFFPEDLSVWSHQHPVLAMLVMLVAGIPMYVCATSSTPIAAALILKGLNPGAALVFLLAGPATNAATINIVKNLFNMKTLMIYLSMIILCSLAMGLLLDQVYAGLNISAGAVVGQAGEFIPHWIQWGSAFILGLLLVINGMILLKQKKE